MSRFAKNTDKEEVLREPHVDLETNRKDAIAFEKFWNPKCRGKRMHGKTMGFDAEVVYVRDDCLEICWDVPYCKSFASFVHRCNFDQSKTEFRREATAALRAAGVLAKKEPPLNQRMKDLFGND